LARVVAVEGCEARQEALFQRVREWEQRLTKKRSADKRLVATDREKNSVERIMLAIDQKAWREKVHQLAKDLKEGRARPEVDKAKLDGEEAEIHRREASFTWWHKGPMLESLRCSRMS
jgi:hypothetical protein